MSSASPFAHELERLPSGRHRLTKEMVAASQRGRLLLAVVAAVAAKGYAATTVADVVERAGVSRRTFYEQFPDKESCFLVAYDTGLEVLLGRIRAAVEPLDPHDWEGRARIGLTTYLETLAGEPDFAWCSHVEVLGAGPAALSRRAMVHTLFSGVWAQLHELARVEHPSLSVWPPDAYRMLSAGLEELVRERLRAQGPTSLPGSAAALMAIVRAAFGLPGTNLG